MLRYKQTSKTGGSLYLIAPAICAAECRGVPWSNAESPEGYGVSQNVTECRGVSRSATEFRGVLQSAASAVEHGGALENIAESYGVH